jgi:hypothetical protein
MKARLLFIAAFAAFVALSVPLFAQARSTRAVRVSHTHMTRAQAQMLAVARAPGTVYARPGQTRVSVPSGTNVMWIAAGLTLRQAVGLAPIPATTWAKLTGHVIYCNTRGHVVRPHCGGGYWAGCSTHSWLQTFGNWPWNVSLTDSTHWCASGGILTSRDSSVSQTGSAACTTNGTSRQTVSGGVGYQNVDWKDIGQWNCDIGITTQGATDWVEMHVDALGPSDYSVVATHSDCVGGC